MAETALTADFGGGPGSLPGDGRLPRYQQLRDDLAAQIAAGTWAPGVPLPAETVLAARYGVSLGTMRKAMDALVAEDLVDRRQGSGTYVRESDFKSSLFRFFRFKTSEGDNWLPQSRIISVKRGTAVGPVARMLNLAAGDPVVHIVRQRLDGEGPLVAEVIWLPEKQFAPLLDLPPAEFGPLLYPLYRRVCGQAILSAEETLSVDTADGLSAKLLGLASPMPVVKIDRLAFGLSRQPLEWRNSIGRADRFTYKTEIR